jgi:hypothetical protein
MCAARLAGGREEKHSEKGSKTETPLQETHCKPEYLINFPGERESTLLPMKE